MALDPQIRTLLAGLEAQGMRGFAGMEVDRARDAARLLTHLSGTPEPVGGVLDRAAAGPGGDIPLRIYYPEGVATPPAVVFFHGGGWTIGSIPIYDPVCRSLVHATGAAVISVEYRLGPEHKFPAAPDDAVAATRWVADHADELGIDATRLAVAGDSAGGNLAAIVAQETRGAGPRIAHQLLIYPATDAAGDYPSQHENAEGYFLTGADIAWFGNNYLTSPDEVSDPRVSPLRADDLTGLPSATIITAEYDPLRDQGHAYAEALRAAGNDVDEQREAGMVHGFWNMRGVVDAVAGSYERAGARVRAALG